MEQSIDMQLADIYDIWYTPLYKVWYVQLILAVAVGTVLFGVYKLFKKWYKPAIKTFSSYEIALLKLEQLRSNTVLSNADKYSVLTQILKDFIENTYHVSVRGLTDTQMLTFLQSFNTISEDFKKLLLILLQESDTIKFAQEEDRYDDYKKALDQAILSIKEQQILQTKQ